MKKIILLATIAVTIAASVMPQAASASGRAAPLADIVTTNDNNQIITYSGSWTHETAITGYIDLDRHTSSTTSDYAQLRFYGTGVSLVAGVDPGYGEADIYIDTVLDDTVDLYSATPAPQQTIYTKEGLSEGYHTIKVVVKGTKNGSSNGYTVDIDAFRFSDTGNGLPPEANDIQCATQPDPTHVTCTQVDTQHITLVGTHAQTRPYQATWALTAQGVGRVYAKASAITVYWITSPWSGSGNVTWKFDVKGEYCSAISCGPDTQSAVIGTYWPNSSQSISVPEYYGEEDIASAGTYTTPLQAPGQAGYPHYDWNVSYVLEVSTVPFSNQCVDNYTALMTAGPYVIDPTIETPLGPEGTPPDEMIYPVNAGYQYMIKVGGDGWHDGTAADLWDADYSWDATTWYHLRETDCEVELNGYYQYTSITDNAPEGATQIYIRATDDPGDFGNNYEDANEHFIYTISLVIAFGQGDCASQFTYDPEADLVAAVTVQADDSYTLASDELVPMDWYVIEVASGSWEDDGVPPARYDGEFSWGNITTGGPDGAIWNDISDGGTGVFCETESGTYATIYTQADNSAFLYLRVADEAGTWAANTGQLGINIYHATFQMTPAQCEMNFDVQGFIGNSELPASAENGITIGISAPVDDPAAFGSYRFEPGAWYMIETADGPWGWLGSTHSDYSYDIEVQWGGDWVPLAQWAASTCNVAIDALGHRRVFFQTPVTGTAAYTFRVADTEVWFNNVGSMTIKTYAAFSLNDTYDPGNSCDYIYDSDQPVQGPSPIFIDATDADGQYTGNILVAGVVYAFVFEGNDMHWHEVGTTGDPLYAMQVSDDGGTTWHSLPEEYGPALCYIYNGNQLTVFWQAGRNYSYYFRVDSSSFADNGGGMNLNIYAANLGDTINPWQSCLSGLAMHEIPAPPGGNWIPVDTDEGRPLWMTDYMQADASNPDTEILGFAVEITNGPWDDGETITQHYDAELSSDNGATWYPLDRSNPDLICAKLDVLRRYAHAYFNWTEGQVWKIRVNDEDTATWADNTGNLGFKLYAVTGALDQVDCVVDTNNANCIPADVMFTYNGADLCGAAITTPTEPTGIDVPAWLAWLGGWVVYAQEATMQYFAWCPRQTEMMLALLNAFNNVEPIATINEINAAYQTLKQQFEAYDWNDMPQEDQGLLTNSSGGSESNSIMDKLFGGESGPWTGGPLITETTWTGSTTFDWCVNNYTEIVNNEGLTTGICFLSSTVHDFGLGDILQFFFELILVGFAFTSLISNVNNLASFMAGGNTTNVEVNTDTGDQT